MSGIASEPLHVLSLGCGVQSSTLALMATHGDVQPMPDCAVFSDTQAEPAAVYRWLDWLGPRLAFPVYRVCQGEGLRVNIRRPLRQGHKVALPVFTESARGGGQLRRQCTHEFKIVPIVRKVRELLGLKKGQRAGTDVRVNLWLGISMDEIHRMKPNRQPWIENRWPLIEARLTRSDCLAWMERQGYPRPPRSACVFCPYHSDAEWRRLRDEDLSGWADAVQVDDMIRGGVRGTPERLYLHRSLRPLVEVDLSTPQEHGQLDLWGSECEGACNT